MAKLLLGLERSWLQAQQQSGAAGQPGEGSEAADAATSSKPQSTPNGSLLSSLSGTSEGEDSLLDDFRDQACLACIASAPHAIGQLWQQHCTTAMGTAWWSMGLK